MQQSPYKAENGLLVNARFLMDKFKNVFAEEEKKKEASKLITGLWQVCIGW